MLRKFKFPFFNKFHSKKIEPEILSYNYVNIPEGYQFLKIISYDINLKNTTLLDEKITEVINYMFDEYKDLKIDIMCFQGIHDLPSLYKLFHAINKYSDLYALTLYYAPDIQKKYGSIKKIISRVDIKGVILSDPQIAQKEFKNKRHSKCKYTKKMHQAEIKYQNIIISKYPIISSIYGELDDEIEIDNVLGIKTVIGANILINNQLITIFNTSLSTDIKHANMTNNYARKKEIEALCKFIDKNTKDIHEEKYNQYNKTNINLIVGTLNFNNKYCNKLHDYKYIDIYMFKNPPDKKEDFKEKDNYIILPIFNEIPTDIGDYIFKTYDIYVIESYFRPNFIKKLPLETILIIRKKKN